MVANISRLAATPFLVNQEITPADKP
jgi:hypothetical protein